MNDRSAQRLAMLQEALASGETLHLRDAAELCGVSEMTIRRDLATQPSPLSLLGGRLVMASYPGVTPVYDLTEQQASHYHVKHRLCQRAASFIDEGDTLFIDCGSTLIPLLGQLSHFRELTVVTYALNVANSGEAAARASLVAAREQWSANHALIEGTSVERHPTSSVRRPRCARPGWR